MQNTVSRFILLAKRWWWLVVLGIVLCGGTTYVISKLMHPVYRATATIIVNFQTSTSSSDSVTASLSAVPTYAQLLASPAVLDPVVAAHPGMTMQQLNTMVTVTPKPNSQLIELDVENTDPTLAMKLANEISDQFVQYINPQLSASVLPVYADLPRDPVRPKPLQNAGIGALVGLGLALTLIFLFEWFDDRLGGPEEIQDLLGTDTLAIIPRLSRQQRLSSIEETPALVEACRMLCTSLDAAQEVKPFKLVMVTSALAGEGKSTVAANLAYFLALAGRRVLLVDADLRHPVLHQHFNLDNSEGLSYALIEIHKQIRVEPQSQVTGIPTFSVLPAGIASSYSIELLRSPMANRLFDYFNKAPFDYVLFDTPPLLPVADAQFLASHIHTVVLVVDASKTPRKVLLRAKSILKRAHTNLLGVAINKSCWPEYGYVREYQRWAQLPDKKREWDIPTYLPPMNGGTDTPPQNHHQMDKVDTLALGNSLNGEAADPNITMTIPRSTRQKPQDEE